MNQEIKIFRCIIVDDESNAIEVIDHHLSDYINYEVLGRFKNGLEASQFLKVQTVDLIFLDIQMPGISGLDFLRSLKKPPMIFLTTAYRHYAPEAFELNVLDYLLKPISKERFRKAIEKFETNISSIENKVKIADYELVVRANRSNIKVGVPEILYLEAMGDYVKIHLESNNLVTKETLKRLMQRLPGHLFTQIHRSYVINNLYVQVESSQYIEISGTRLPISRSYRLKK